MKKVLKGLAVAAIFTVLNFGLTTDAQAAEIEALDFGNAEYQEMRQPPPPPDFGRHRPPPPPHHRDRLPPPPPDYRDYPPPPPHHGHKPPPPPRRW